MQVKREIAIFSVQTFLWELIIKTFFDELADMVLVKRQEKYNGQI